jgi:hypothetical protein
MDDGGQKHDVGRKEEFNNFRFGSSTRSHGVGVPTDLGTICFYRVIVPTDRYRNDTHHPYHKYKDNDHKYSDQEHGDDSAHDK